MKKITAIVLLLVIVIASLGVFVACDKKGNSAQISPCRKAVMTAVRLR